MRFVFTFRCWCIALLLLTLPAPAQEIELDVGGIIETAQEWAKENLDEDVLRSLPEVDRDQVEKFLKQFQDQLKGDYVLDLAALKGAAKAVLPLLDAHDETKPYAAWLRSRLDYFEVAEELRRQGLGRRTQTSDLLVFGKRAGEYAARFAKENALGKVNPDEVADAERRALTPVVACDGADRAMTPCYRVDL